MSAEARCAITVGRDRTYLRTEPRAGRDPLRVVTEDGSATIFDTEAGCWLSVDETALRDLREVR
ncbi:hypothetical protein [Natronomonas marina]|uniref:hypothetical protein n=1 Tax=Natronomonas marina TaxID=2961939 RepID=UPI0020C9D808|nr:hypothetical protein [Natronomonas marina]